MTVERIKPTQVEHLDARNKQLNFGDDIVTTDYNRKGLLFGNVAGFANDNFDSDILIEYFDGVRMKRSMKSRRYVAKVA